MSNRLQKIRKGALILAFLGLIVAVAAWWYHFQFSDHFHSTPPLDLAAYSASANSLRGNDYKLEGEVVTLLAWSPSGRLISVGFDESGNTVPILLPQDFASTNIQRGERFRFLLTVADKGVLQVKKLSRL